MDINATVKLLLSDASIGDDVIDYWVNSTKQYILNYCNLVELPSQLENTLVEITCLRIRYNQGGMGSGVKGIASVSDGSQSVSYSSIGQKSFSSDDDLIKSFNTQLNRFRRLKW